MATWKMVEELGTQLPETVVGLWYGKPALKIGDKGLIHLGGSAGDRLSIPTPEKDDLVAERPDVFVDTDHLRGTPWVLVDLSKISKAELRELLADAWRIKAPPKLRKAHPEV